MPDALVHFEPTHVQRLGTGPVRADETAAYVRPRIKRIVEKGYSSDELSRVLRLIKC
jgi:hypothetical protein